MSDWTKLQAICPALANAGRYAAEIAEKDERQGLIKLSALSECLIRLIFHFEGLEDPATSLPPSSMINRLTNRGLLLSNPLPFFQALISTIPDDPMVEAGLKARVAVYLKLSIRLISWFICLHPNPGAPIMKKCPFCAEEIQDEAIKCKHCGEFLDPTQAPIRATEKTQWYFRTSFIILAVACVGPLALPLIWWRPQTSRAWKIGLTIGILVLTWILFQASLESLRLIKEYFDLLNGL